MTISELGALGEFLSSIMTLATLGYLAVQIRQNTAQQKREELVSIQHGQNTVLAHMLDPHVFGAFVRGAAAENPTVEDRSTAQFWVLQYLNHFQIVHDLHESRAIDEDTYQLWAGFAVAVVAPKWIRQWWDDEGGRFAFHPGVRDMIQRRLDDPENPPRPITEMWSTMNPAAWEAVSPDR